MDGAEATLLTVEALLDLGDHVVDFPVGLNEIVIGPFAERRFDSFAGIEIGEEEDGDEFPPGVRAQASEHFDPVYLGHHDIEENEIGAFGKRDGEASLAIPRGEDFEVGAPEREAHDFEVIRFVFYEEDFFLVFGHSRCL